MIVNFDHTTLLVRDIEVGISAYRQILGREPTFRIHAEGLQSAFFVLDNATLRIASPNGAGAVGDVARAQLDERGEGLFGLVFRVDDIGRTYRRLRRLSLEPCEISDVVEQDPVQGSTHAWKRTDLPSKFSHGIPVSFASPATEMPISEASPSSVRKMDLLVVATGDPERAAILYGARLGLPLSFDQINGQSNSRLMQFPFGDMLIEVVHRPEDRSHESDRLWGIGWSVADADAARDRLLRSGRNVSDVKVGAKPNTRVFTVRDGTCNIPTLVVEHLPAHRDKAVE